MTPTAIVKLAELEPKILRQATTKLQQEIEEIEKHPEKATKIREIAAMAPPKAPGDLSDESDTPNTQTLRSMMGMAQEHGRTEGKAVTKLQLSIGGTIILVL